jgi:DNA adenine methylase
MRPLLKWVGGKTQILDKVQRLFPTEMHNYHEPFVGGGSVLLATLTHRQNGSLRITGTVYASDLNAHLIRFYKTVQADPEGLIVEMRRLIAELGESTGDVVNRASTTLEEAKTSPESYYYWCRAQFNALAKETNEKGATARSHPLPSTSFLGTETNEKGVGVDATVAALFLFLNKTCFRGVYREGPRGFNVPYGNYKNPQIVDEDHLRAVSALLAGVVFTHAPFQSSLERASSGDLAVSAHRGRRDFVYLDPPYAPETAKSFVGYTADGFGLENHTALFAVCKGLQEKGADWLMSNADVPLVREAFPLSTYSTTVVSCRRAIHSKTPDARTNEVLIQS